MNRPNIESLLLTPEELVSAKKEIEKLAFRLWENAGSPELAERDFWLEAHVEWFETSYVPNPVAFLEGAAA